MADSHPRKIVYLFGAGATHAELANLERDPSVRFEQTRGLLIKHVSDRVVARARHKKSYLKDIAMVSNVTGSLNIELFISLIESSRIRGSSSKTSHLKNLVRTDITSILTRKKLKRFYLHRALLELHKHDTAKRKEELIGLVSLNYDRVLDEAYRTIHKSKPNYAFATHEDHRIPLLKLHGSFNWNRVKIRGRSRNIEIIPLGYSKDYLHTPYNFIWTHALELLIRCDVLRVIGCSLSPNDIHLIDLLFKAHLERGTPFEIQIIASDRRGEDIQQMYGFFPEIKRLTQIETSLIADSGPPNPFRVWLASKGLVMLKDDIKYTRFLTKVVE